VVDFTVVEIAAEETHELRLAVLRNDTPTATVTFPEDDLPGTFHLGVRDADGHLVAISTWIPRLFHDQPAVQLRGMATAPRVQGQGAGAILLEAGCARAAATAPLVWARARDSALAFYVGHGFVVDGEGFIDDQTLKPHHIIVRRLP
jgi:predicted GNAT family N-acyltransferase